ncbi:MAG: hypothetical protein A2X46_17855 [Lentisphaerae bacterium GWF2_57_35]|nr:MAG: hypothetical protein A2X46_17855 [Lentisphaerae bacterium GWF2_57_35]
MWQNCGWIRVFPIKSQHTLDIPLGKTLQFRHFVPQFGRQPGNDARAPTFTFLAYIDRLANVPIKTNQLRIDGQNRAGLGDLNTLLHVDQQRGKFFSIDAPFICHGRYPPSWPR